MNPKHKWQLRGIPLSLGVVLQMVGDYVCRLDDLLDKPMAEAITDIESNPAGIYGMLTRIRRELDKKKQNHNT